MGKARIRYGLKRKQKAYRTSLTSLHPPSHLSFHFTIACINVIALYHVSLKDLVFQVGSTSELSSNDV